MTASLFCPPPDPNPRRPRYKTPDDACDCHAHIIGPASRFPFVADRSYTPPDALLPAYRHVLDVLGIARSVLVQPSMYGTDNTVMMDAIASCPDFQMRAIVVVPPDVEDSELAELHKRGARGVRLNLIYHGGGLGLEAAKAIASRIKRFGWHLQVLIDVSTVDIQGLLQVAALPVPVVVDHMGHFDARKGAHDKGFQTLIECVRRGNTWVKLSGAYRLSAQELPFADVRPLVDALVKAAPSRLLWGTDWPHTVCKTKMPNDGSLLDVLSDWLKDEDLIRTVLVKNPAVLYQFEQRTSSLLAR